MKKSTTKNQLHFRNFIGLFLIISASLLFVGCDKNEALITPSNPAQSATRQTPSVPKPFLVIDHQSIGLGGHDYKVSLCDDGMVLFEGRANVAYLRHHVSYVSAQTVYDIKVMFRFTDFFSLPSSDPNWRMPFVETTFTEGLKTGTVRDVNDMSASPVIIQIRTKAEELMNIKELIERSPKPAIPVAND